VNTSLPTYATVTRFRRAIPAGETVTRTATDDRTRTGLPEGVGDGRRDIDHQLVRTGESRSHSVQFVNGE